VRFTVVGHDGKKRHAAVILSNVEATQLLEALSAAVGDK
jgi:mRNA-degrading endonuclease toxin of MazEF toxin-antitoxin module